MDPDVPSPERIHDVPAILRALRHSAREAMLDHKRTGHPMATWRDGQVVWVQPEDLPVVDPLRRE